MLKNWICLLVVAPHLWMASNIDPANASPRGEELHKGALTAFGNGNYIMAKELWEQAYKVDGEPKYLYNLARMAQEMDRPVEAVEYLERFISVTQGVSKYLELAEKARSHIAALSKRVTKLTVVVPQLGAKVFVDQKSLGAGPLKSSVLLLAGKHIVSVTLREHHGVTRTLDIPGGGQRVLTIHLRKISSKIVTKMGQLRYPLPRWLPWVGLGIGLAIAGGGSGSLVVAKNAFDDYDRSVSVPPIDPHFKKKGELYQNLGIGLLVTGGVIVATSLIAVLLNKPKLIKAEEDRSTSRSITSLLVLPRIESPCGAKLILRF